jgi:hypothetical protein
MHDDGVAIHRHTFLKSGWHSILGLAPTPDSFTYRSYITMICELSSVSARNEMG